MKNSDKLKTANDALNNLLPILNEAGIDGKIKALVCKTIYREAGIELPFEIKEIEYFYSLDQIAAKLNIYSKSGKLAINAVTAIIQKLNLTDDEKQIVWESNGSWQGTIEKYTLSVVKKIEAWLQKNKYPHKIPYKTPKDKTIYYHVVYKKITKEKTKISMTKDVEIVEGQLSFDL